MNADPANSDRSTNKESVGEVPPRRSNVVVRQLDRVVVLLIRAVIVALEFKSRNPTEDPHRLVRPDTKTQTSIGNWRAMLEWPAKRRVGCFVAVLLGLAIGIGWLWYSLRP